MRNRIKPDIHFTRPPRTATDFFTGFVWLCLVFFGQTNKNQTLDVGNGKNQSKPDTDMRPFGSTRLYVPNLCWKSLVLGFGIVFWYRHFGPCRWLGAGTGTWPVKPTTGQTWALVEATPHQSAARCGSLTVAPIMTVGQEIQTLQRHRSIWRAGYSGLFAFLGIDGCPCFVIE